MDQRLDQLNKLLDVVDKDYVKGDDFVKVNQTVLAFLARIKEEGDTALQSKANEIWSAFTSLQDRYTQANSTISTSFRKQEETISQVKNELLKAIKEFKDEVSLEIENKADIGEVPEDLTGEKIKERLKGKLTIKDIVGTEELIDKKAFEMAVIEIGGKLQVIEKRTAKGYGGLGGGSEGTGSQFLSRLRDVDLSGLTFVNGKYVLGSGSGSATWGSITGTITNQTDLVNYIASQVSATDFWDRNAGTGSLYPMTLTDKVGIGINAPTAQLHVVGGTTSADFLLKLGTRFTFRGDGVMNWGAVASQGILSWSSGVAVVGGATGNDLSLVAAGSEGIRILASNRNVGIGTTSPLFKLHVKRTGLNGAGAAGVFTVASDASTINDGVIQSFYAHDSAANEQEYGRIITKIISPTSTTEASEMSFWTMQAGAITQRMTLASDGNVGVGAIAPYKKFEVVGGPIAVGANAGSGNLGLELGDLLSSVPSSQVRGIIATGNSAIGVAGDIVIQPRSDTTASTRFFIAGTEAMRVHSNRNVGIGTTSPSSKLDVTTNALGVTQTATSGIALVNTTAAAAGAQQISPALRWSANGWKTDATAGSQTVDFRSYVLPMQGTANPTGALVFQSSINATAYSTGNQIAFVSNGGVTFGDPTLTTLQIRPSTTASNDRGFVFSSSTVSASGAAFNFTSGQGVRNPTTGATYNIQSVETFNPTSGTAPYTNLLVAPTINQTGGANGITRGIHVSAGLTAAADFRAIETSNSTGFAFYAAGTANSYFGGNVGIGTLPTSTSMLTIGASTTAKSAFNTGAGVDPTTPVNGDWWTTSTHAYVRLGGVTYQLDQQGGGGGTGTVTSVSVVTANGISGSVATATTTPAITLTLGAITPTSVNGITLSGSGSLANSGTSSLTGFTGSGTSSGTNTGDQTITLTGDITGSGTGSFATAIAAGVIVNADINASAAIAVSKLAALTANRAIVSDGSGFISAATTTATEIGYVNGVTSSIQTQLNAKQGTLTLTTTGTSGAATLVAGTLNIPQYANTTYSASTGLQLTGTTFSIDSTVVTLTGAQALSNKTGLISQWTNDSGYTTNTGTVTSVSGTTNRITVATGTTTPVIDISATFEALLGKVASPLSQFASTTSAQLAGVISDETGSGALVFGTAPSISGATITTSTVNGVTLATGGTSTLYLSQDGTYSTPAGGGGITWTEVTGTSQAAAVNNGYITNNAALVTVTLPSTAAVGSIVRITGKGGGGWRLAQNASQYVLWTSAIPVNGVTQTTPGTGGRVDSTDLYDSLELICIVANTVWSVLSVKGNPNLT